jgi:hypothetical protein
MQPINRKKVSLTLILSAEDNEALENLAFTSGLKKSEYLRAIIQGISLGNKISETMSQTQDVKLEIGGYGLSIPSDVMQELIQDASEKLMQSLEISELRPNKNLRYKRMKTMAQAS